jgi:drug/metabolite transporter (DMT)-like permease
MTNETKQAARWQLLLAFGIVYLVWGSTYLGIRYAVATIPPLLMAGSRFLVAGAVLYFISLQRTAARPKLIHWRTALVIGFLLLFCGNGGVTLAEQWVPSGITALLVASEPLWIVLLNWLRPGGRAPSARESAGVLLGFGGVALLIAPQFQGAGGGVNGHAPLWASLLVIGAALAWATGSLYGVRAQTVEHQPMANGMTMLVGGGLMLFAGFVSGETAQLDFHRISATSMLAWVYLVLFGSLAAFSAYAFLMRNVTPAKASTYAFVNPAVAVLLGWSVANEPFDGRSVAAIVIIIGAVMLLTIERSRNIPMVEPEEKRIAEKLLTQE